MKVVFIGGGAHRYLPVARSLLSEQALLNRQFKLVLHDLAPERMALMREMIVHCPEYTGSGAQIECEAVLDRALEGADVVTIVIMPGSRHSFALSCAACGQHGFTGTDQLSPSGAFLALKGGPVIMNIARKMEKLCPDACLLDFANPVPVFSAAVNNHTKIKCFGVCAGYTNHQWDLTRILGADCGCDDYHILSAGVNHMSFILPGSTRGTDDLYRLIDQALADGWRMPELSARWSPWMKQLITNSVTTLVELYRKYGYLLFSSEPEGLQYLDMAGRYVADAAQSAKFDEAKIAEEMKQNNDQKQRTADYWQSLLNASEFPREVWSREAPENLDLLRDDQNIMSRIIKAVGGVKEMAIATSFPNRGAVPGFTGRMVLEYSQFIKDGQLHAAENLYIPPVFYGLMAAMSMHQTLLGDAVATEDPRLLFDALYSFPVKQDSADAKALYIKLLKINAAEIPAVFQQTADWLNR